MNRIYLFLFALLAASVGFNANAWSYVKLTVDNGSGGNWDEHNMQVYGEGADLDNKAGNYFTATFEVKKDNPKFYVEANGKYWGNNESTKIEKDEANQKLNFYDSGVPTPTFNVTKGWYTIKLYIDNNSNNGATILEFTDASFYFYGDMNRWSCIHNASQPITIKDANEEDATSTVFPNSSPYYRSEATLNNLWKFKEVDNTHQVTTNNLGITPGSGWLYLDFKNLTDAEGNTGRLCGQFKVTSWNENGEGNWGVYTDSDEAYYNLGMEANDTKTFSVSKGDFARNIPLSNNYIENAVLYFNPSQNKVYVTGTPKNIYVYYAAIRGNGSVGRPSEWYLSDLSQYHYTANSPGFNSLVDNGRYSWEQMTVQKFNNDKDLCGDVNGYVVNGKINYNGVQFDDYKVYRRRIPTGATHRYPVEFKVNISNDNGTIRFPQAVLACDDIWFVESTVNMYYRYEDEANTNALKWVCYNAFSKNFDAAGIVQSYNYLFGGTVGRNADQPLISEGTWGVAIKKEINDTDIPDASKRANNGTGKATWWCTPISLPVDFSSNAWAMFSDSRGAVFPAERVKAVDEDLNSMEIMGNDVYFVVPTTNQNPEILYSHLKGTAKLSDIQANEKKIQISAEFFDPAKFKGGEYELNTDLASVTYNFDIYYEGKWVAGTGTWDKTNHYTSQPFFEWDLSRETQSNLSDFRTYKPGYYFVVVKAMVDDEVYTSTDVYPIF